MRCFRIFDFRYPPFDGAGAFVNGGRWNSAGRSVVYAAETYAGAILEILVRTTLSHMPKNLYFITIEIPNDLAVEELDTLNPLALQAADVSASRAYGDRWMHELRSTVLLVPSLVTQGREHNILLNPSHPHFPEITHTVPEPVQWDERVFRH